MVLISNCGVKEENGGIAASAHGLNKIGRNLYVV
jgi:hypothetical protein